MTSTVRHIASLNLLLPGGVVKTIRLTLLSPVIIRKSIIGDTDISTQTLRRNFTVTWSKQEKELL